LSLVACECPGGRTDQSSALFNRQSECFCQEQHCPSAGDARSAPIQGSNRVDPQPCTLRRLRHGTNGHVQVLSRNLRDLAPSFPELTQAARSLPAGTLLDGEIVIADESGNADFGALQQRLTGARRAAGQVALQRPAVLLVFDVLELGGVPLTELPLRNRCKRLEDFLLACTQACS
jgi:hypothetical protein